MSPSWGGIFGGQANTGAAEFRGNANPASTIFPAIQDRQTTSYPTAGDTGEYDSGTDSDAASSCGDRDYDFTDVRHMADAEQQQEFFGAMEYAKGRWRQYMRNPVRKV